MKFNNSEQLTVHENDFYYARCRNTPLRSPSLQLVCGMCACVHSYGDAEWMCIFIIISHKQSRALQRRVCLAGCACYTLEPKHNNYICDFFCPNPFTQRLCTLTYIFRVESTCRDLTLNTHASLWPLGALSRQLFPWRCRFEGLCFDIHQLLFEAGMLPNYHIKSNHTLCLQLKRPFTVS